MSDVEETLYAIFSFHFTDGLIEAGKGMKALPPRPPTHRFRGSLLSYIFFFFFFKL